MTKILHVMESIVDGGLEQGVLTLIQEGFYGDADFHIVELFRGSGAVREKIRQTIGNDRIHTLIDDPFSHQHAIRQGPGLIGKIDRAFSQLRPDAAILSSMTCHVLGGIAAVRHPDLKLITFEHSAATNPPFVEAVGFLASRRIDAIFGDTPETLQQRKKFFWGNKPSYNLPLTILEPGRPRTGNADGPIKIVSLGRLVRQKNHAALIKATAQLIAEGHNVTLTIAGEGTQRPNLERLIQELDQENPENDIAGRISLPGHIPYGPQLRGLLDRSHIYVQASLGEGFCLSLAEALASGLPAISALFAGSKDYGTPENMKFLKDIGPADIAEALRDLVVHYRDEAPRMSREALKTVSERFVRSAVEAVWHPAQEETRTPRRKSRNNIFSLGKKLAA